MESDEILALAHREAWRYKKSTDPHHSDTYTFNRSTLLEFARKLVTAKRKAWRKAWMEAVTDEPELLGEMPDEIKKMPSNVGGNGRP